MRRTLRLKHRDITLLLRNTHKYFSNKPLQPQAMKASEIERDCHKHTFFHSAHHPLTPSHPPCPCQCPWLCSPPPPRLCSQQACCGSAGKRKLGESEVGKGICVSGLRNHETFQTHFAETYQNVTFILSPIQHSHAQISQALVSLSCTQITRI